MANINFPTSASQKTQVIFDDDYTLADEGDVYIGTNPTPGTAITGTICVDDAATASSTHAQFAPALLLFNNAYAQDPNAPNFYLRYIKLIPITPPASATSWQYSLRLDSVNRYSSAGSAITPVSPNPFSSKVSKALLYAGAIVPTGLPTANARLVGRGVFNSAIPVLNDQYAIVFGNEPTGSILDGGTTAKMKMLSAPPVIIPPGWSLSLDAWGASNAATAWTFEFEMMWAERIPGL